MKEKVLKAVKTVHDTSRFVKLIFVVFVCIAAIIISLIVSGTCFAYNVNYCGKSLGLVAEKSDFYLAKTNALKDVVSDNKDDIIANPEFSLTMTLPNRISDVSQFGKTILDNTHELVKCTAVMMDGEKLVVCEDKNAIQKALDARLCEFDVSGCENKSEFVKKVELKDVYCKKGDVTALNDAEQVISQLSVKTVVDYKFDVSVDFKTITKTTSDKPVGYSEVTVNGENGINRTVERVEFLNGKEVNRQKIENQVVKEPVNRVVVIGTGSNSTGSDVGGMMFPLPRNASITITTQYGEASYGHVHKGIDYAVAKNTPIYAAMGGTVEHAGTYYDYGNCVIINHGNGVKTLYAHCNALYVSAGQTVKQGQTIGAVGSTGQSTGFHLHFEVKVNGGYVNPARYVQR